jgi:hypothetical protein
MSISLPPLPYALDALQPHVSANELPLVSAPRFLHPSEDREVSHLSGSASRRLSPAEPSALLGG